MTEDGEAGGSGERWIYTPSLGAFHVHVDEVGNYLVTENRLRAIVEQATLDGWALRDEIDRALGVPWDRELETFRGVEDGATVTWLHGVG